MTSAEACAEVVRLLHLIRVLQRELDAALLFGERQAAGWRESIERNRDAYRRLYRAERELNELRRRPAA
jgi:hypothetical protein